MSNVVTKVILGRQFVFKDKTTGATHTFPVGLQFMPFRMAEAAHAAGAVKGDAPVETPATAEAPTDTEEAAAPKPKRTRKPKT